MRIFVHSITICGILLSSNIAAGQTPSVEITVASEAIRFIAAKQAGGTPILLSTGPSSAVTAAVAQNIGMRVQDRASAIKCIGGKHPNQPPCRMFGGDVGLNVAGVWVKGDTAYVDVGLSFASSKAFGDIWHAAVRVKLTQQRGGWKVVESTTLMQT